MAAFLTPAAAAAGPEAGRFMRRLFGESRLPMVLGLSAGLNVLSGFALYGQDSNGFHLAWIASPTGLTLTIGALSTILAMVTGAASGRAGSRLEAVGREIETSGPSPERMATIAALRTRVGTSSAVSAALLLIAVVTMAIARYV